MNTTRKIAVLLLFFLSIGLVPMILAPAPTAQTLSATSITQTSAVLRGRVNPNGLSTQVDFCSCDPSASPTYFSPTPLQNIGSGNANVTVTYTLSGLTPGTTYSYCVRSVNSAGSQNGACVNFTTSSGGGPTAQTLSATSITQTSAVLRGRVNPNGLSTQVDFCSCDPSASPTYFSPTPLQNIGSGTADVTVTYTLSGLTPGTTYSYCVRSVNSAGSQNGACVDFTTSSAAATGSLQIHNDTSGYDIYIDGFYVATASSATVTLSNISAGVHSVRLTKPGCEDVEENVTINSGSTTTINVSMTCGEQEDDDDGDGVPNSEDSCFNPDCNLVDNRGCPKDTDNDGIDDCDDDCPTERGPITNDGCPAGEQDEDRDGDGITDDKDACYNPECSIVDTRGCPRDSDDDGLDDCEDECPSDYGERQNEGCPEEDADSDGVPDDRDSCYNPECTRVDTRGCPLDSDNDGLNDCEDNCPNQSGPRSNSGCPQQGFCLGAAMLCAFLFLGFLIRTH